MSNRLTIHASVLIVAFLMSACGGSSSSIVDDLGDQANNIIDNNNDEATGDNDQTDTDTGGSFVFDPWAAFPDITYTTLDQLPPLAERLFGGATINPITTGAVIGTGEFVNENLFRDIPFVIDGEVTEGLVIEKLYVARGYVTSSVDINGVELAGQTSRLDWPRPTLFAIVTNLSSIDLCGVNTFKEFNQPNGIQINMTQGDADSLSVPLLFTPGVQFASLDEDANRRDCINSGGSVIAYSDIDYRKFSEFHEGDDYVDIEDIESINIARLVASPKQPVALETGLVTLGFIENPNPGLLNPLASFYLAELDVDRDSILDPGEERTQLTSTTGKTLFKTSIPGTSNVILFIHGYVREKR